MEWVRVKSEGNKQALRVRQVFNKERMPRIIRIGALETIVQIRNGENHFMDKLGRDIGFTWRFCQTPEAEMEEQIVKSRCGIELIESMLKMHQGSCKRCRRVINPNYTRKRRLDARVEEEPPETVEETTVTPIQKLVDSTPTTLAALVLEMSHQRDCALNLAAEYDMVIAAVEDIDLKTAQIREIEEQMKIHRKALLAFVAPKDAIA